MSSPSPEAQYSNVARWTRTLGSPPEGDEEVVLVPPDESYDLGLAVARELVAAGRRVRVIARGATSPTFLRLLGVQGLLVTEFDAYLPADKGPELEALTHGLATWLRTCFSAAVPSVDADHALRASCVTRLGLQDVFDAWCAAGGLARVHRTHSIRVLGGGWPGIPALRARLGAGARLVAREPKVSSQARWTAVVAAAGAVATAGALGLRLREFGRERSARSAVERARARLGHREPEVWLGAIGGWAFSSRHVLGSIARAAAERGVSVGLLLQSTLRPGDTVDAFGSQAAGGPALPVLSALEREGTIAAVDQVVSFETARQMIAALPTTLEAIRSVLTAISRAGPMLNLGSFAVDLESRLAGLMRLATIDVLRAREAFAAATSFAARRPARGARIAWSHSSVAADSVPDLVLQQHGATTYDVVHGALAETLDMVGTAATWSTYKLLWTEAEAKYLQPHVRPRCIGGCPARALTASTRNSRSSGPVRVLVLTNYATLAGGAHRMQLPRLGYQGVLFAALERAVRESSVPLELRWRPHPGDDQRAVDETVASFAGPRIELSRGGALEVDFHWCDVVVSSLSSVIVEALMHPVPVLVHDIPLHEDQVLMHLFEPGRRFRDEGDLPARLSEAVVQVLSGVPLQAEETLKRNFFGHSGVPRSPASIILGDRESGS